jgi:putative flippase GtrA
MDSHGLMLSARMHSLLRRPFLRFLGVGVLNTVFGYSLFALFIYCGLVYPLAVLLATCAGIVFNFRTLGGLVFRQPDTSLFWRFVVVYLIIYVLNVLLLKIGTYFLQNIYINGAIGLPLTALTAYLLNKHMVFQRRSHATD